MSRTVLLVFVAVAMATAAGADEIIAMTNGTFIRVKSHEVRGDQVLLTHTDGSLFVVSADGVDFELSKQITRRVAAQEAKERVKREAETVEVRSPEHALRGVEADMNAMPDAALALAVVALFAEGSTTIRNIANLRIKETDRLAALETQLRRLGGVATTGPDWLRIEPAPLHGAEIDTYDDHRIAMAFALAGLRVPGVSIRDPGCVSKTWPNYFDALERL